MATPADQLDQLLATTLAKVKRQLADQITKETPLLAFLSDKGRVTVDGGKEIRRPLMFALNDTVKSYSGYDPIDTTPQGGIGYAVYPWKQVAGSITISGEEERKNSGAPALISLLAAKVDQLRLSYEDALQTMLYADGLGNGGKDFLGLSAIVGDTGTLGGIDSATETWWKAYVRDPGVGGVDLTTLAGVSELNNVFNSVVINTSRVELELTTQANFEAYEDLARDAIRFQQTRMADLGFESIAHKTADVVLDTYVPNDQVTGNDGGRWYFLNSRHLEFVTHVDAWMRNLGFQRPVNQDARTALVISMGNLITDMRRGNGVIPETTV